MAIAMTPAELAKARRHLIRVCPTMGPIATRIGPCKMTFNPDSFAVLCRAIIGQQLSTKAADSIGKKVLAAIGGAYKPKPFLQKSDKELRACGLSNGKVRFLRDLVAKVLDGTVPIKKLPAMDDAAIRECLLEVTGIGPWTVDMFLMFGLGRPDVLPVGDLAIRVAFQRGWGLAREPTVAQMHEIAEPWRPYRTVGSWYLWRTIVP
jgi:DNA-3-methyladenine glycosylase II